MTEDTPTEKSLMMGNKNTKGMSKFRSETLPNQSLNISGIVIIATTSFV